MRYLESAEQQYNDLVDHIQDVFEVIARERWGHLRTVDPHIMLDCIESEATKTKIHYDQAIERASQRINQDFETIGLILKAASKSDSKEG